MKQQEDLEHLLSNAGGETLKVEPIPPAEPEAIPLGPDTQAIIILNIN